MTISASNSNLILYLCIARSAAASSPTILAEFSRGPDLQALGNQCIQLTPPFHSFYSHTLRGRSYTFLIADPLVCFAVSYESLPKPDLLQFLDRLQSSFRDAIRGEVARGLDDPAPYCFQSQFDGVLRELMRSGVECGSSPTGSPEEGSRNPSLDGGAIFMAPLLGSPGRGLKKKKRCNGELVANGDAGRDVNYEKKLDVSDLANGCCRDFPAGVQKSGAHLGERQRAKQVWRRHVWVVLSIDLFVCVVLFGVWLWVCRGFQCMDR